MMETLGDSDVTYRAYSSTRLYHRAVRLLLWQQGSIVGVVTVLFGIGFVAVSAEVPVQYGVAADAPTILMSRYFDAALIQIGLLVWLARHIIDSLGRGQSSCRR
jgi:hypothetical protein